MYSKNSKCSGQIYYATTLITDSPLNNLLLKYEVLELSIKSRLTIYTQLEWLI